MCRGRTNNDVTTEVNVMKMFSMKEVRIHRTMDDAWLVNNGKGFHRSGSFQFFLQWCLYIVQPVSGP